MREHIFNSEYIEDKELVYNILKKKKFDIKYVGLDKMNEEDNYKMYHYKFMIDKEIFDYYEGVGHDLIEDNNKHDKILNALYCVLQDGDAFNLFRTAREFGREFGYEEYEKAQRIFKLCKITSIKLSRVFTKEELTNLRLNILF